MQERLPTPYVKLPSCSISPQRCQASVTLKSTSGDSDTSYQYINHVLGISGYWVNFTLLNFTTTEHFFSPCTHMLIPLHTGIYVCICRDYSWSKNEIGNKHMFETQAKPLIVWPKPRSLWIIYKIKRRNWIYVKYLTYVIDSLK